MNPLIYSIDYIIYYIIKVDLETMMVSNDFTKLQQYFG